MVGEIYGRRHNVVEDGGRIGNENPTRGHSRDNTGPEISRHPGERLWWYIKQGTI